MFNDRLGLMLLASACFLSTGPAEAQAPPRRTAAEIQKEQDEDHKRCLQIMDVLAFLFENDIIEEAIYRYVSPVQKKSILKNDPIWREEVIKDERKLIREGKRNMKAIVLACKSVEPRFSESIHEEASAHLSFRLPEKVAVEVNCGRLNFHKVDGQWYWLH